MDGFQASCHSLLKPLFFTLPDGLFFIHRVFAVLECVFVTIPRVQELEHLVLLAADGIASVSAVDIDGVI